MKKFVCLLAVLAIATISSATMTIGVGGVDNPPDSSIVMMPSETAPLQVFGYDEDPPASNDYYIFVEGPGSINGATIIWGAGDAATYYEDLEEIAAGEGATPEDILMAWGGALGMVLTDASHFVIADTSVPTPAQAGILVDNILFHCEGMEDVTITLMDGSTFQVLDTQVIHQIPEPMTVALLGLGGLFLRRRK